MTSSAVSPRIQVLVECSMYGWTRRARSAAGVATVYGKGYAADHGCIIAEQKHNGSGDFGSVASCRTVSRPMPPVAPVTSTVRVLEVDHGSLFLRSFDVRPVLKESQ